MPYFWLTCVDALGCSNQMQVVQGHVLVKVCASFHWLLHPAPTSVQDGLDPLQLLLVVCFQTTTSANT